VTLWTPSGIGTVVASRVLKFVTRRGTSRKVEVRVGRPVRRRRAGPRDPWWTPLAIRGIDAEGFDTCIAGADAMQSLVLALLFLEKVLPVQARDAGGSIEFLGRRSPLVLRESGGRSKSRSGAGRIQRNAG
jgi:hypothetical protein